jgi:hypothetical protein
MLRRHALKVSKLIGIMCTYCIGMFMAYSSTKSHMPSSNDFYLIYPSD